MYANTEVKYLICIDFSTQPLTQVSKLKPPKFTLAVLLISSNNIKLTVAPDRTLPVRKN